MSLNEGTKLPENYTVSFNRTIPPNHPSIGTRTKNRGEVQAEVKLAVHPGDNGVIVISYPGVNGHIDGYNNKYGTMADHVRDSGVGAVVRTDNMYNPDLIYEESVQDHLRAVIDYALAHSVEIANVEPGEVRLHLMGFSAGAGAIAAIAHEYPQVSNILLVAPAGDAGPRAVIEGLNRFTGATDIGG